MSGKNSRSVSHAVVQMGDGEALHEGQGCRAGGLSGAGKQHHGTTPRLPVSLACSPCDGVGPRVLVKEEK